MFTSVSKASSYNGTFKKYVTIRRAILRNIETSYRWDFSESWNTVSLPPSYSASLVKDNLICKVVFFKY